MLVVTHEMAFAREVASNVIFCIRAGSRKRATPKSCSPTRSRIACAASSPPRGTDQAKTFATESSDDVTAR